MDSLAMPMRRTETENTGLGKAPVPDLAEIAKEVQFEPYEITKAEFEEL